MRDALKRLQQTLKEPLYLEEPKALNYLFPILVTAGQAIITPHEANLFLDSRYLLLYSHLPYAHPLPEKLQLPSRIQFDGASLSFDRIEMLKKQYPETTWTNLSNPLMDIRIVKSEEEQKALEEAALLNSKGFDYIVSQLKEGMREDELARKLHLFFIDNGGDRLSFDPIIAFGVSSAAPHYRPTNRALKKGDIVLIDIGVRKNGYHSDMTRTLFFGEPHPELKKIYEIVKEAQAKALASVREGISSIELDRVARDFIIEKGYGPQFGHSLGHGVGIDIHEFPFLRSKPPETFLREGMCITIEPGIYLPGLGGVRIEDMVLVTKDGYIDLTKRPKELKVLTC